jgi:hypothetical protein
MLGRAAVVMHSEAGVGAPERLTSRFRDGLVRSATNLVQLVAAIGIGIGIGKAAHLLMAEEQAATWNLDTRAADALRAEPSHVYMRTPEPTNTAEPHPGTLESSGTRHAPRVRVSSSARASPRAGVGSRPTPSNISGSPAACNLAPASVTGVAALVSSARPSSALSPAPSSPAPSSPAPSVPGGSSSACPSPQAIPLEPRAASASPVLPPPFAAGLLQRAPAAADRFAPASDDWLGEQLAILGRAERGLLEGDPEDVVRSLDEYNARFPDGLLDPQMASIRQRIEERFTAFIFP